MSHPLKIFSVDVPVPHSKGAPVSAALTHFDFAPDLGAATLSLIAEVDGKSVDVFARRDLTLFQAADEKNLNAPFQFFNVPLFPMANRLVPNTDFKLGDDFTALVENVKVKIPTNHQGQFPDARPHHLHGLAYRAAAVETTISSLVTAQPPGENERLTSAEAGKQVNSHFKNFFRGYWTSDAELTVTQKIQKGEFYYRLCAKNSGSLPMPVAFGSHPYFQIPSKNPRAVKLLIPANQMAEIDQLDNVFPTGRLISVKENKGRLDFTKAKFLREGVIDHFFIFERGEQCEQTDGATTAETLVTDVRPDVQTDVRPDEKRTVALIDVEAGLVYRLTGLTSNIVGVQVYYPGQGSVIAIEMVTNLPDPRKELWKTIPTGMQILMPGESADYEYCISVEKINWRS